MRKGEIVFASVFILNFMIDCSRLGVLIRHPARIELRPDWAFTEQFDPLSLPQEATKSRSNKPTNQRKCA